MAQRSGTNSCPPYLYPSQRHSPSPVTPSPRIPSANSPPNKASAATSAAAMGSKSRTSASTAVRRLRRRLSNSKRRPRKPQVCRRRSTHIGGGASVSDKMEALRNLIPCENAEIKPDQLFRETADYIVLLETQVFFLQKLVDFYGSQNQENQDAV